VELILESGGKEMKIDENAQIVVYYEGLDKKDKKASEIKKLYLDLLENGITIYDKKDDEKNTSLRAMIMLDKKDKKAYMISVVSLNKKTMNEILIYEIPLNAIPSQMLHIEKSFFENSNKKSQFNYSGIKTRKEQFLEKHELNELDWHNLIKYEEVKKTGKMNMFEYLNFMREFNVNGGKKLASWILTDDNYGEFLEVLNSDEQQV
jgi:hypothetical protein